MSAGPGNEKPAAAAGRGHFRASHADREHVIGTLKDAFVQGRLSKDELDHRAGRALVARTYADLAALTADLPPESMTARPTGPGRSRPRRPGRKAVAWGLCAGAEAGGLVAGAAVFSGGGGSTMLWLAWFGTYGGLCGAGYLTADSWKKRRQRRRSGQPPPRRAQHGTAIAGDSDNGTGMDLMFAQGRPASRQLPGDGVVRGVRRPACFAASA